MSATATPQVQGPQAGATVRTRVRIEIDGTPLDRRLAASVSAVLVRQALGVPAAAEIDFIDPVAEDVRKLRPTLRLGLGIDQPGDLFEGSITGLERDHGADGAFRLRIRAYDALHVARRRSRVRSLEGVSAGDVATQIAGEIGLAARIGEPGPTRDLVLQRGESDLSLLRRLGGAAGLYPVVIGRELHLLSLDGFGTDIPVRLGRELQSIRLTASNERALRRVEVLGWNVRDLAPYRSSVTSARQDQRELHDSGIETDDTLGLHFLLDRQVDSDAEANGLGEAAMDAATASAVAATGTLFGDTRFVPGRGIHVEDLPGTDAARLVLSEVVHRIDTAGDYRCSFSTQAPSTLDLAADRPLLTRGRVVDVTDPEGAGRCRVAFDAIGDIRSGWLQIVVPGAGKDKGAVALPEVGDEVLTLVAEGNLTRGFVLGGLYGQARLPRGLGRRGKRPLVLRTAAGQALQLDSEGATARLSTATGNVLELTAARTRLASATDMVIEAPGRTLTIRADRIRFEQG